MPTKTETKPLPLGKPRATAYLAILEKRLGKRKTAVIEKTARELAAEAGQRVVRFEFVAQAAGVPLQQMLDELTEQGIRTSAKDVRFGTVEAKAKTNGAKPKAAAKPASKGGQGNGRKATAKKGASPKLDEVLRREIKAREVKADPKSKATTKRGSAKQSASSRKPQGRAGQAASSSAPSKTAQLRQQRERQASAAS